MSDSQLVWVDIETTGLDPTTDSIIEVALVVTDGDLKIRHVVNRVIAPTRRRLEDADDVVRKMHETSGLAVELRDGFASAKVEAEDALCSWLFQRVFTGPPPMCGSSVAFDRKFLEEHMPSLAAMFHYRSIDVSTVKELVQRWYPDAPGPPKKTGSHRALSDIYDSINELQYYRRKFFQWK